jgi:signal transduction histidine kinase
LTVACGGARHGVAPVAEEVDVRLGYALLFCSLEERVEVSVPAVGDLGEKVSGKKDRRTGVTHETHEMQTPVAVFRLFEAGEDGLVLVWRT